MNRTIRTGITAVVLLLASACSDMLPGGPGTEKLQADLVGINVCGDDHAWKVDSIREFKRLDITGRTSSGEIIEYDVDMDVGAGDRGRVISARAIYKKRNGEWVLSQYTPLRCRTYARIAEDKRMAQRFTDNGDGTVTDSETGLMWKRCAEGLSGEDCTVGKATKLDWQEAMNRAENAEFAGYDDWRLPEKDELLSLVNKFYHPTIYPGAFPHTPAPSFWSASQHASYSYDAWNVLFYDGHPYHDYRGYNWQVRLVRSGK